MAWPLQVPLILNQFRVNVNNSYLSDAGEIADSPTVRSSHKPSCEHAHTTCMSWCFAMNSNGTEVAEPVRGELVVMNEKKTNPLAVMRLEHKLCRNEQNALCAIASFITFQAEETIFQEGDRHPYIYWLADGQITLQMTRSTDTVQRLMTLSTGDLLAWSALLANQRMSATAKSTSQTRLLQFSTRDLNDLFSTHHHVGYQVMRRIANQLALRLLATRLQMLDIFRIP